MKVLLVHNFYQSSSPSGEDAVYGREAAMLKNGGVEIVRYERHNDDISGTPDRLKAVSEAVWSRRTYREISALVKKEKPDVAHFHNIWYLISPSAYYACKDAGVPVVQTLHNFRMFCANGLFLRDGKVCEDCVGKTPWRAAAYGCYRNSRLYSLPVSFTEMVHRRRGTWVNAVDAYIALTEFGRNKFIECGLPAEKLFVKPNFLANPPSLSSSPQNYAVFIGRLSQEKGLNVLSDALRILSSSYPLISSSFPLKIVGDGPLMAEVRKRIEDGKMGRWEDEERTKAKGRAQDENGKTAGTELLGRKSHDECMQILSGAAFTIMPAICYENFPLSIVEAFAYGKPVIASDLGAMASIIKDRETGLLFHPGNAEELASKMKWMIENPDECRRMGKNARMEFEAKYTADANYEILRGIYEEVLRKT